MANFTAYKASNSPAVNNPEAVQKVLDSYHAYCSDVCFRLDSESGTERLIFEGGDWPRIIKASDSAEYGEENMAELDDSPEGLMLEISPYLKEKLIIQAVGTNNGRWPLAAAQWEIEPGGKTVKLSGFTCE
jgi:hypothetical protein